MPDPVCQRLMSMPGIGVVVALTFRAAVDDPARFRSSKRVGPWVGLTPSRNQSGERDVSGGITKAGAWPIDLAENVGSPTRAAARTQSCDGRPRTPHRCHTASDLGRWHNLPIRCGAKPCLTG
ncbi:transposase IS116/IS110/IS902 family protein [Celeribacter indicus]|uniref:Transposase IS116/IS110/IS902 family protein n=1 Tax=Celeribacter indicus TaxID=1208324 RepID=A0A0B5DSR8_9RHOB|nr:transposase IS116/IS110/IS902 family protein [Celeribacter indicus]